MVSLPKHTIQKIEHRLLSFPGSRMTGRESTLCSYNIDRSFKQTGLVRRPSNVLARRASVHACSRPDDFSTSSATNTSDATNASGDRTIAARRIYGRSRVTSPDLGSSYECDKGTVGGSEHVQRGFAKLKKFKNPK